MIDTELVEMYGDRIADAIEGAEPNVAFNALGIVMVTVITLSEGLTASDEQVDEILGRLCGAIKECYGRNKAAAPGSESVQ